MSNDENHGGPRDPHDAGPETSGVRSISDLFGNYNILGSGVQVILDGRPVTCPSLRS